MSDPEEVYWTNLATFYSPMRRKFDEPARPEYESDGVNECDYCSRIAPARIFIQNPQYRPVCLCCMVRYAYKAPVEEDDDDVPIRPAYARQLLKESDFGRRRVVDEEDVDEEDLEDLESGRIFGSTLVHRPTGRTIHRDEDGLSRLCMVCPGECLCWLNRPLR